MGADINELDCGDDELVRIVREGSGQRAHRAATRLGVCVQNEPEAVRTNVSALVEIIANEDAATRGANMELRNRVTDVAEEFPARAMALLPILYDEMEDQLLDHAPDVTVVGATLAVLEANPGAADVRVGLLADWLASEWDLVADYQQLHPMMQSMFGDDGPPDEAEIEAAGAEIAKYRRRVADVLVRVAKERPGRVGPAVETVAEAARHEEVREHVAIILERLAVAGPGHPGQVVPALVDLLDEEDPAVLERACRALGVLEAESAVPELEALASHEKPQVRVAAEGALERIPDK